MQAAEDKRLREVQEEWKEHGWKVGRKVADLNAAWKWDPELRNLDLQDHAARASIGPDEIIQMLVNLDSQPHGFNSVTGYIVSAIWNRASKLKQREESFFEEVINQSDLEDKIRSDIVNKDSGRLDPAQTANLAASLQAKMQSSEDAARLALTALGGEARMQTWKDAAMPSLITEEEIENEINTQEALDRKLGPDQVSLDGWTKNSVAVSNKIVDLQLSKDWQDLDAGKVIHWAMEADLTTEDVLRILDKASSESLPNPFDEIVGRFWELSESRKKVKDEAAKASLVQEKAQTLPSPDLMSKWRAMEDVRHSLNSSYWTAGRWTGDANKLQIWAQESKKSPGTTIVMLMMPKLRRPCEPGERLTEQQDGLHITIAYIRPLVQSFLLTDALAYQLDRHLKAVASPDVHLELKASSYKDMLLVKAEPSGGSAIWHITHLMRTWVLQYMELGFHLRNYNAGRQAWHYEARHRPGLGNPEAEVHLPGMHLSIPGVKAADGDEDQDRKKILAEAASYKAKGSKAFDNTSLDVTEPRLARKEVTTEPSKLYD